MPLKTISLDLAWSLNHRAVEIFEDIQTGRSYWWGHQYKAGSGAQEAAEIAADDFNFSYVDGSDDCWILYNKETDEYANLWRRGPQSDTEIRDGGVGFDDQIDWWVEKQAQLFGYAAR